MENLNKEFNRNSVKTLNEVLLLLTKMEEKDKHCELGLTDGEIIRISREVVKLRNYFEP